MQKQQLKSALPQGTIKFSEILEQQLNQFSDAEVQIFLDRVVEEVNAHYEPEDGAHPKSAKANLSDSKSFKVRKIDHITKLYHMETKIAGGSSCSVYKARDLKTGNVFAGLLFVNAVDVHTVSFGLSTWSSTFIFIYLFSETDAEIATIQHQVVPKGSGGIL